LIGQHARAWRGWGRHPEVDLRVESRDAAAQVPEQMIAKREHTGACVRRGVQVLVSQAGGLPGMHRIGSALPWDGSCFADRHGPLPEV
jgi:hypothetical protein